jgi:hypothetical protein
LPTIIILLKDILCFVFSVYKIVSSQPVSAFKTSEYDRRFVRRGIF